MKSFGLRSFVFAWISWSLGLVATAATPQKSAPPAAARAKPAAAAPASTQARDPYLGAIALDAASGDVLFEENADAKGHPASMLKLMTLTVVLDKISAGEVKLDDMVKISAGASKIGGSQVYLDPKESFTVEELLYAMMVQSANDAATALAEHIAGSKDACVELMNRKARELKMDHSTFQSVHGLPPGKDQAPDWTTARDFAVLCRDLVTRHPEALKYTSTKERTFRPAKPFIMRTHNPLLSTVEGCDGLKTGYYREAGFSIAATAQKNGVRALVVVLGSTDRKVRDAKAAELLVQALGKIRAAPATPVALPPPAPASPNG